MSVSSGGGRIAAYVERAVKRHPQRPRRADELARAVSINLSVRAQRARHNALRARLLGPPDVFKHDREFGGRVEEVTAPGPNQHVDGDVEPLTAHGERTR